MVAPPGTTKSKKTNKISSHTLIYVCVFYPKFVLEVKECVTGGYLTKKLVLGRRAKDQGPWIADRASWKVGFSHRVLDSLG